jgi:galactokinase
LPPNQRILVADTGVRHTNVGGEFNLRVAACRAGVACLRSRYPGITHLRDLQDVGWCELASLLPEAMSVADARLVSADLADIPLPGKRTELRVRACCRHVHSENQRVRETVAALVAGDVEAAGKLLNAAHASARDDYGISCPELEIMVDAARAVNGTAGARLTGAGWGGCVVALVHRDAVPDFTARVSHLYRKQARREPNIFACRAGGPAGAVGMLHSSSLSQLASLR